MKGTNSVEAPDIWSRVTGRRRFIGQASASVLLGSIVGCADPGAREPSAGNARVPESGAGEPGGGRFDRENRLTLAEPGPMLPPVPAVFVTANGAPGDPDEISVLWSFVLNGDPPQVGVSAGAEHVVGALIERHGEFVLNVPTADLVERFDTVDMSSSRVADKFELAGLTRGRAVSMDVPTVEEAAIHLECRVLDQLALPPARTVFVAEVIATTVLEGTVDEAGRLIVPNVPFFGMTAGSGEHWTMGRRVGNIGMTVGRDDIRY